MAITGSQQAYTFARSGLARSGATRSNYVPAWSTVDLIGRDSNGNIVSRTDLTLYIRQDSLSITQALNDEPDTCSFQIVPTAPPSAVPKVGQEIVVVWTPGGEALFHGFALVVQFDRRARNESPWVSVQCQDAMWAFDARMVTYRFPAQSVSASIAFLVTYFCNKPAPYPFLFTTTFVQATLPSIPSFDVVNQRPSTVMRTLMAAVEGAFYIDGFHVHAWAGGLSEPGQPAPQPLTNTLASLKTFRVTSDATQLRQREYVEGKRTSTLVTYPSLPDDTETQAIGVPVVDASIFTLGATTGTGSFLARIGTQWVFVSDPIVVGGNPPQTHVRSPFTPGDSGVMLDPMPVPPPARGWLRAGGQFAAYSAISGDPLDPFNGFVVLMAPTRPYGVFTATLPIGETVEWVDAIMHVEVVSLGTQDPFTPPGAHAVRGHPADTPVVLRNAGQRGTSQTWPSLEGFVQDGRYSYDGAGARAQADVDAFAEPLVRADWETEDLHAAPGRPQVIALTGTSVMDPLNVTLTITRVEVSFPLRSQPPRRRCTGGDLKPSTFLDLVLTDQS